MPPQSIPVSLAFDTPSLQVADRQKKSPAQTPLTQSVFWRQPSPPSHGSHSVPPQSMSVSAPFRLPSLHWSGRPQVLSLQTVLWQSRELAQARNDAQGEQVKPPQSMSVSPPFETPSVQVGAWQTKVAHTPLAQSRFVLHPTPSGFFPGFSLTYAIRAWQMSIAWVTYLFPKYWCPICTFSNFFSIATWFAAINAQSFSRSVAMILAFFTGSSVR
jgi:hypothetical protein